MKKWRNLTDDEADEELKQIALERQLLEDSYLPNPTQPPPESNPEEGEVGEEIEEEGQSEE
jgi:hypothetical protein